MRRLAGCLAVGLVTVTWAASSVAQDPPGDPAFSSYWEEVHAAQQQQLKIYLARNAGLPNGDPGVHGLRLNRADNPWLPPLDTPTERFQAPPDWTWRPDLGRNAWRVSSPNEMPLNLERFFTLPVTHRPATGEVARIVAEDGAGRDVYFFTSQQLLPKAKRGALPLVFTLPQQDVTATFTSPSSACGLVRNFTTGLKIGVRKNFATIFEPRSGDTVKGTVNPKTYTFKATGATEVYAGGIKDLVAWASYGYTRIFGGQPCTAGYLARIDLIKEATIAPACKRPQIVAPRSVVLRAGRVRIRVAGRCAGQYVAGLKLRTRLLFGTGVRRTGAFTTKATPVPVTITLKREEQNPPQPKDRLFFEFRSPAQMGLDPAVKRVRILVP